MSMEDAECGTISVRVEFTGGLELLFSNQREHEIALPAKDEYKKPSTMGFLVRYICDKVMKDKRKDMFVVDGNIRPGVLVLINDADWELEGEVDYEIRENDKVLFVSTLHGG